MKQEDNLNDIVALIRDKRVLYITTKNLDYIRVCQECNMLKDNASKV